jgi:KaiB domain
MSKLPHFKFRLYIAGDGPHSVQAVANLNALCCEHLAERHEIEIVDVLHEPQRALDDKVMLTPDAGETIASAGPKDHRQPEPARDVDAGVGIRELTASGFRRAIPGAARPKQIGAIKATTHCKKGLDFVAKIVDNP